MSETVNRLSSSIIKVMPKPPNVERTATCPACGDEYEAGHLTRSGRCYDCASKCEQQRHLASERWKESNLPPVATNVTFSEADPAVGDARAMAYAKAWEFGPRGLYLWGAVGAGKTFLAFCLANHQLRDMHRSVLFLPLPGLFQDLKASFSTNDTMPGDLLQRAKKVPLLILDDLGIGHGREFGEAEIVPIVDARTNMQLPAIYTSNHGYQKKSLPPGFTDYDHRPPRSAGWPIAYTNPQTSLWCAELACGPKRDNEEQWCARWGTKI